MSKKVFQTLLQGLEEARAYMEGERVGYKVTVLPDKATPKTELAQKKT